MLRLYYDVIFKRNKACVYCLRMIFHRRNFVQRGTGIGGTFSSLYRATYPAAQKLGKEIVSSPLTQNILKSAKQSAAKAGLTILKDALLGRPIGQSAERNLSAAKRKIA